MLEGHRRVQASIALVDGGCVRLPPGLSVWLRSGRYEICRNGESTRWAFGIDHAARVIAEDLIGRAAASVSA